MCRQTQARQRADAVAALMRIHGVDELTAARYLAAAVHTDATVGELAEAVTAYPELSAWLAGPGAPRPAPAPAGDPADRLQYFTGVGHPNELNNTTVPLFVSASTLARYRTTGDRWPVTATGPWAGDSGAYAALMLNQGKTTNPWWRDADEYGGMWVRFLEECGRHPDFVAVQDWPCEADVLARTGGTVAEHQAMTLESYLYLREQFPMVPWLPVLQGWRPEDYVRHHGSYLAAGVDLTGMRVGVGSVCRRGSQKGIAAVFRALAPLGMRLHGFGVSMNGLRLVAHLMASSDSQAWSLTAKNEKVMLPGCDHRSRKDGSPTDCRNCLRYALHYRDEVRQVVRECWWAAEREAAEVVVRGWEQLVLDLA